MEPRGRSLAKGPETLFPLGGAIGRGGPGQALGAILFLGRRRRRSTRPATLELSVKAMGSTVPVLVEGLRSGCSVCREGVPSLIRMKMPCSLAGTCSPRVCLFVGSRQMW